MHEAAATLAGGTLVALDEVMAGRAAHAFVPFGGLHHAMRARAGGFCVYNDLAVAIAAARAAHPGLRVAYVDLDAHHGDGMQALFWDDPEVLTISLHESGEYLFPGTGYVEEMGAGAGYGYSVNAPLPPFSGDEPFVRVYAAMVPPLLRAFRPDVIVAQMGCDTHWTDPLTEMATTTNMWGPLAGSLHALAHELCAGRLVATGGGGYQTFTVVPRAWTLDVAALLERELPDAIPPSWLDAMMALTESGLPDRLSDRPAPTLPLDRQTAIDRAADLVIARIQAEVFPLHAITPEGTDEQ
jgi:acetoin utilization protein AcuC